MSQDNNNEKNKNPEEEAKVVISKKQLTDILRKLDRLESSADKTRLQGYDEKNKLPELPRVKLNAYEDPQTEKQSVIVAWRMVQDEVFVDTYGIWHEKQTVLFTLEDGSEIKLPYADVVRKVKKQEAELLKNSKDNETGYEIFELRRLSDGKVYNIDARFVN